MAVDPSVRIDIAAEFTGKKAFKQADTATAKLTKSVKTLAGGLGLAFGTAAVINFSKQAVKAFAQDEAAAVRLTRAVENLGIGFANPAISKYISELEKSAAIADDILRPAFQGLLTTTGSLTQSQKLLNDAITISRASGIDLATVSMDLARGYVGITKGLKKYNTGLTTAEISSMSFADVLGVILTRSAGAADDYLQTTQYRMDTLSIATGNASEIIGGGLVNAFARIGGGTEASDAAQAIEDIAEAIAFTTTSIGSLLGVIPNLIGVLKNLPKNILGGITGLSPNLRPLTVKPPVKPAPTATELSLLKQQQLLAKLEADALKRQKELLALQKKQSDATKKAAIDKAKLDKAAAVFELQKIQIAAALKGKISEEERIRLLLMQAIEEGNAEKAEELAKQLELIIQKNIEIAEALAAIGLAKDPFSTWAGSLSLALVELAKYGKTMADINATTFIPGVNFNPSQNADRNYDMAVAAVTSATAVAKKVIQNPIPKKSTKPSVSGLGGPIPGVNFNPSQNADRNYDANTAVTTGAIVLAGALTNNSAAGTTFNSSQNKDGNVDSGNTTITIVVEGNVLDGDDFTQKVNDALLNGSRTGMPQTPAGTIIDGG